MGRRKLIEPMEFFDKPQEVSNVNNAEIINGLMNPMIFEQPAPFTAIDTWIPSDPSDEIFKTVKGAIMTDVSTFYGMEPNPQLDSFIMSPKRSYNNPDMRNHTIQYLNYFEKFYDKELELKSIYCKIKYLIDCVPCYDINAFLFDLKKYIMTGSISLKLDYLNRDNYALNLTYKNVKNPNLQYSD